MFIENSFSKIPPETSQKLWRYFQQLWWCDDAIWLFYGSFLCLFPTFPERTRTLYWPIKVVPNPAITQLAWMSHYKPKMENKIHEVPRCIASNGTHQLSIFCVTSIAFDSMFLRWTYWGRPNEETSFRVHIFTLAFIEHLIPLCNVLFQYRKCFFFTPDPKAIRHIKREIEIEERKIIDLIGKRCDKKRDMKQMVLNMSV